MVRILWVLICLSSAVMADTKFQAIDLNAASREQLKTLPGVGDKLAQRILDYREKNGAFRRVEDVAKVQGFRPALVEKLKGQMVIGRGYKNPPAPFEKGGEDILGLLRNYPGEPSVKAVQDKAIAYARLNPAQIKNWEERARTASWAPRFSSGLGRDLDRGQSVRERTGEADIFYTKDSANWTFDLKAEWHLSELVFSRHEMDIAKTGLKQTEHREKILDEVTRKYFERRRIQVEQKMNAPQDSMMQAQQTLALEQLTADVDALTGGWFSQQIERTPS